VYNEGKFIADGPFYLTDKGVQLLSGSTGIPIEIQPHFTDGDIRMTGICQQLFHAVKYLPVIISHILGVQPQHGIAIAGTGLAEGQHGGYGPVVDIGKQNTLYTSPLCPFYDKCPVFVEFRSVDMAMGICHDLRLSMDWA
jgi:hypothetical protein